MTLAQSFIKYFSSMAGGNLKKLLTFRPGLLEAWLVLTSVKYHGNLYILIPLNQRLVLTRLRATGPRPTTGRDLEARSVAFFSEVLK